MSTVKYERRDEFSKNNLSRGQFNSKWEYSKAVSQWHFDPKVKENDIYKVFLGVRGDWSKEIANLKYEIDVGTVNYGFSGKDHDHIIENDYLNWGYNKSMIQYQRTYEVPDQLMKVAECLHLKHPDVRIHRQMPGMVAPIHIDTFCSHPALDKDPSLDVSLMRRFVIQLTDWDFGHLWMFGNQSWHQWSAGDIAYFESRDVVHCTANAGKIPRVTMIVTGWLTDETRRLIDGDFSEVSI